MRSCDVVLHTWDRTKARPRNQIVRVVSCPVRNGRMTLARMSCDRRHAMRFQLLRKPLVMTTITTNQTTDGLCVLGLGPVDLNFTADPSPWHRNRYDFHSPRTFPYLKTGWVGWDLPRECRNGCSYIPGIEDAVFLFFISVRKTVGTLATDVPSI